EFREFARRGRQRNPVIRALEWAEYVPMARRHAFERASGISIKERDGQEFRRAADRAAYLPVRFVEPLEENSRALGFDLISEEKRLAAVEEALVTGTPTSTPRVTPAQDLAETPSLLLFFPVYKRGRPHATEAERRAAIVGFAVGVLR